MGVSKLLQNYDQLWQTLYSICRYHSQLLDLDENYFFGLDSVFSP